MGVGEDVESEGDFDIESKDGDSEVGDEVVENKEEIENENTDTYALSFLNSGEELEVEFGEQVNLKIEIKNTGTADWKKENISLNVFGGLGLNKNYYHGSWVTNLRPSVLDADVPAGEVGSFSFVVNTPQELGEYNFKVQAVQINNNFQYIEGGFWEVGLKITEEEIIEEEDVVEKDVETDLGLSDEDGNDDKNIIEKIVEEVKEVIEEVKEVVKRVFYGGGGGGSPAPVVEPEPEVVVESPEVEVTSHTTSTTYVATSTVVISGTKNEATEIIYINSSTADIVSSTAWELNIDILEGENSFEIYGENSEGEKTATTTISIFLDITPPNIPTVAVIQSEYATPTLYISWEATDDGVGLASYDVKYSVSSTEADLFSETTSTNYSMEVDRLETYEFSVRAYDSLGNVSDWSTSTEIVADWPRDIVINEVAWMGTRSNKSNDEWIELYNNTDEDIDLSEWQILVDNTPLNFTEINNIIIQSEGYLLLERTDDDSVLNVGADIIYTGSMSNDGLKLVLKDDSGNTIDVVDCSQEWYAGSKDNSQYRSMARVDTNLPGSWSNNWQTYQGVAPVAKPYGGGALYGSPGYKNTGHWLLYVPSYYYADLFNASSTWILTTENSPYVLDYETEIPVGYKIQVDPGVVIYGKSNTSYFKVSGELEFNGTAEEPIIITSALDKNYVEDNKSTLTGDPTPGDWSRIDVQSGGIFNATQTKFLYGGTEYFERAGFVFGGTFFTNVIHNNSGFVNLSNTEFSNNFTQTNEDYVSYNSIVWSENASTTISNSLLNGGDNIGTVVKGGYALFDNTIFSNLNTGIEVRSSGILEMQNTIENNFQNIINHNWFPTSTWTFPTST